MATSNRETYRAVMEMETSIAEKLNKIYPAKRQPGSGNKAEHPNDVAVRKQFHVECKLTFTRQILLKLSWYTDAMVKALSFGVPAVLAIKLANTTFFMIPEDRFYSLLQSEKECDARVK